MPVTSDSRSQHFQVGTARVKISPVIGMPYLGYGWDRQDPFLGVNDDLWAKALVIDDGERVAALVACDMIGFPPAAFAAAVRAHGGDSYRHPRRARDAQRQPHPQQPRLH